ncbi:MAG: DUF368 domain-containing protein [Fibromonadaceae bacterium]|jgi:putative membrane protein|nr:DUF368 domain-containing protein [Fibromonadaceae bacterium]
MTKKENQFNKYILLYVKGIAMGTVDLVPGVSGGTIALITGIYEEFIHSLKSFTFKNFKLLFSGKFKTFWETVNGTFMLILALGIGTGIFSMIKVVLYVIGNHFIITWSFFFGLILISVFSILRTVRKLTLLLFACFCIGATIAFFITSMSAVQTPNALWFIFVSGSLAVCALLLPGTSGSVILLLLGKYQYILDALNSFKIDILAAFAGGAIFGMLSFSHFLSWLLRKYHDITVALLSGLLLGSLNKIYPWKVLINTANNEILPWNIDSFSNHSLALIEKKVFPHTFEQMTGVNANFYPAIISAVAAIAIYTVIDTIAKKIHITYAAERRGI